MFSAHTVILVSDGREGDSVGGIKSEGACHKIISNPTEWITTKEAAELV